MPQRYLIVGVTALAALLLYIDRVCISILADLIQADLALTEQQKESALSAFFLTYALFQIPVGALADRHGPRLVLTVSIALWSVVTAMTGLAWSFGALLAVRLLLGLSEAGAYPAAACLIKRWARPDERGRFNSVVSLGGRIGGAFAPTLTTTLGVLLAGVAVAGIAAGESGVNWRGVFVLYGVCGLAVAGVFWLVVRDHPPAALEEAPSPGGEAPPPSPTRGEGKTVEESSPARGAMSNQRRPSLGAFFTSGVHHDRARAGNRYDPRPGRRDRSAGGAAPADPAEPAAYHRRRPRGRRRARVLR